MFVYIVRHAWAGHYGDPEWPDDFERPLTADGRKRFGRLAAKLVKRGVEPASIATSPLVRCRQTAKILAEAVPGGPQVDELDALTPGSDLAGILKWTNRQHGSSVAWVGHAPDVGQLTGTLVGDDEAEIRFAKAACAAVRFDGPVEPAGGELYWLATARLLGC